MDQPGTPLPLRGGGDRAARVDDRLQELDFGDWEGVAWDDVPARGAGCLGGRPLGVRAPAGESGAALVARVRRSPAPCRRATTWSITHGGPLKVLTALLAGRAVDLLAPPPAPGSILLA